MVCFLIAALKSKHKYHIQLQHLEDDANDWTTHINLKEKLGVIQIYFRRYPRINKIFWWSRFLLIRLGCRDI